MDAEQLLNILNLSFHKLEGLILRNGFKTDWETAFKPYWVEIQRLLPAGTRICPVCGDMRFRSHLESHGVHPKEWYDSLMKYESPPLCPTCGKNELEFNDKQLCYRDYCCAKCANAGHTDRLTEFGVNFLPMSWTDEQIKNRGYSGKDDPAYISLVQRSRQYQKTKKREISLRRKKYALTYGDDGAPHKWTEEQIRRRGYSGFGDAEF